MQDIPQDIIGTSLHQIWHGNPDATPPIHIWTKEGDMLTFLGINSLWEKIEQERETPSAVLIIALNIQTGGGPYFLYWTEDEKKLELMEQVEMWRKENLGERQIKKITAMSIGNTL